MHKLEDGTEVDGFINRITLPNGKTYALQCKLIEAHPITCPKCGASFELAFGKKAKKDFLPLQPGDVLETFSDMSDMKCDFDFSPQVNVVDGVKRYVDWYKSYYGG